VPSRPKSKIDYDGPKGLPEPALGNAGHLEKLLKRGMLIRVAALSETNRFVRKPPGDCRKVGNSSWRMPFRQPS